MADGHADSGSCPPHAPARRRGADRRGADGDHRRRRVRRPAPHRPAVYGVAYATPAQLQDLRVAAHRRGGNNTSRYNWQQNADNRGNDWFYESIAYDSATAGADVDDFIGDTLARRRRADGHHPHHRLGGEAGPEPQQAGQLLGRPSTARSRTATGSGTRTPATACWPATGSSSRTTTRTTRACPRTARSTWAGSSTSWAAGAPRTTAGCATTS